MRRFVPLLLIVLTACQASTATPDATTITPIATEAIERTLDAPIVTDTPAVGSYQATRNAINAENTAIAATNWDAWHPTETATPLQATPPFELSLTIDADLVTSARREYVPANPLNRPLPEHWKITLETIDGARSRYLGQLLILPTQVDDTDVYQFYLEDVERFRQAIQEGRDPAREWIPDPVSSTYHYYWFGFTQEINLDFGSGAGVRFLGQRGPGPVPITNDNLYYMYLGLTTDGKYIIVLDVAVTHPDMPATYNDIPANMDIDTLIGDQRVILRAAAPSDFTPSLDDLDALVQSIKIK